MRVRRGIAIAATLIALGALTPSMASAETTTAAQPSPTATVDVSGELPFGWDKYGPYFLWGTLKCRIHLFKPWEWRHMWGTGPCWF